MSKMTTYRTNWPKLIFQFMVWSMALVACSTDQSGGDPQKIRREMREKSIVRATEPQIIARAEELGHEAVVYASQNFDSACAQLNDNSCTPTFHTLSRAWFEKSKFEFKRFGLDKLAQSNQFQKVEQKIVEAYAYNLENKQPLVPNVQKVEDKAIIYSAPLTLSSANCLKCHSQKGTHTIGDTIGIWMITMPRKEVILSFAK